MNNIEALLDQVNRDNPNPPTIEHSLASVATSLHNIDQRLGRWDNGGGLNLVPGEMMRDHSHDLTLVLNRIADGIDITTK